MSTPGGPLVSVGLPVYNGGESLRRALDSLLGQTWANLEIVVSDNASTDGTADVCREYAQRDPRVKFYANPANVGVLENLRSVCLKSTGELFFWAGHDDRWEPRFVERLAEAMGERPEAGVGLCAVRRVYDEGDLLDVVRYPGIDRQGPLPGVARVLRLLLPRTATRKRKYNLFVCGMFRGDLVRRVMGEYSFGPGERPLVAAVVADHDYLFVDEELMDKTVHRRSFDERYTSDTYHKKKKAMGGLGILRRSFGYLFSSSVVSLRSKLTVLPASVLAVAGYVFYDRAKRLVLDNLPEGLAQRLRGLKAWCGQRKAMK